LAVVPIDIMLQRPDPPATLSEEEAEIWREIVAKVKPGWFYASEHLLVLYVRTLGHERGLAEALRKFQVGSPHYEKLIRLQRSMTLVASRLAAQLRLTPRSTVDRYAVKAVPQTRKPWEDDPPAA
jgi:hypothetical protein